MKQAIRKLTSITLAICMLLSGGSILVQGADGTPETSAQADNPETSQEAAEETSTENNESADANSEEENTPETDTAGTYLLHIPVMPEQYTLKYDEEKLDKEKTVDAEKDVYLEYAPDENVSLEIIPADSYVIAALNVVAAADDAEEDTAVEHTYEQNTLTFVMPDADTEVQISVASVPEQETLPEETDPQTESADPEGTATITPSQEQMPDQESMEEIAEQFVREQSVDLSDDDKLGEVTVEPTEETGVYELTLTFVSEDGAKARAAKKEKVRLYDIGTIRYAEIGFGADGLDHGTHHFRVSWADEGSHRFEAFCIEPDKAAPGSGEYSATRLKDSNDVAKTLYYGYGGSASKDNVETWPGFQDLTEDQQYVITHAAAGYLYTKSESRAYVGLNSKAISLVKKFISFVEKQDAIPDPSVDFLLNDKDGESVNFNETGTVLKATGGNDQQTSPTIYLECDPINTVTIYPPANVTYHEINNQKRTIQGTGDTAVTITAGTRFYFTAPAAYNKKDYTTKNLKGDVVTRNLTAYKISNGGSVQDMAVMFDEGTVEENLASLKIEWLSQGQIKIEKIDKETGKNVPYSSACSFKDAEYQIFSDKELTKAVATLKTNENGEATSEMLPFGTYYVKESKAPIGYELDETVYTATINTAQTVTVTSKEQVKRANVSLMKYLDRNMTESELQQLYNSGKLAGIRFVFTPEDKRLTPVSVVTDRYGWATTATQDASGLGALTYGKWTITEENTPDGYEGIEATDITIDGSEKDIKFVCYNKQVRAYLRIVKKDSVTGSIVKRSSAKFQIFDKDGNAISMQDPNNFGEITDVFATNKDGIIYLPQQLEVGSYTLVEVEAPEGYVKADPIQFEITSSQGYEEPLELECKDAPQMGRIKVTKTDAETGEPIGAGFQYEVKVLEDIVDGSGAVRTGTNAKGEEVSLTAGTVVDYLETDEESQAVSKELFTGKYVLTETVSGEYYSKSKQEYPVTLVPDTTVDAVTAEVTVTNEKTAFDLVKVDSTEDKVLEGITFHISSDKDEEGKDYVTDQDGRIHLTDLTHDTTYHVQEKATLPGYNLDPTVYDFHVDELGLINGQSVYEMKLTNQPNILEISKKDISQKEELPGATLIVYDSNGTEVEKWVSTEEPHMIKGLPAGEYVLHEEIAPERYSLAEDIAFTLTDSLQVEHVVMYDDLISIEISKVDITNEKELEGAELTVTDSSGKEIDRWVSTTEPHKMNLAAGVYTLTEVTAPDKYATASSIQFEVTSENTIQKVVMKDTPIQVEISKQDITDKKELEGAHLKIETLDGETVEEWTSTKEPHKLNLSVGKYILSETSAPKGYDIAEKVTFEVTDTEEVQKVVMFDSPTDGKTNLTGKKNTTTTSSNPGGGTTASSQPAASHGGTSAASPVKTGDDTPIGAYVVVAIVAAAAVFVVIRYRRRKK